MLEAFFLGAVQGLTELWPISSSAHLVVLPKLLSFEHPLLHALSFDVALHGGTLAAVLWYFRKDWLRFASSWNFSRQDEETRRNRKLCILLIMATVPAGIAGIVLEKQAETLFRDPRLVAAALALGAFALAAADLSGPIRKKIEHWGATSALLCGFFQALAIVPGVSRSGAVWIALRGMGFHRQDAARITFWMSAPVIFGALLVQLPSLEKAMRPGDGPLLAAGLFGSFFFGWVALRLLFPFLQRRSLLVFAVYRALFAIWIFSRTG